MLASAAIAIAAIGVVAAFNLAPTFVYMAVHGQDAAVVRRTPSETEFEGLKISQLVLPVEQHRIQALADVQTKSTKYTPTRSEGGQQLGFIGALGFAGLLVALLVAIRRERRGPAPEPTDDEEARAPPIPPPSDAMLSMGVLTVVGILMATISGFSILVFGFGIRELRSWNRISVFIAFFAFTVVAYGLDWIRRRLPARWWTTPVVVVALAAILVDRDPRPGVAGGDPRLRGHRRALEQRRPARGTHRARAARATRRCSSSRTATSPRRRRWEPSGRTTSSGPYLHSDSLRWSFGGMLGRDADWQASTAMLPARRMLDRVAAVGFDGLLYDFGSTYQGGAPSADEISAVLGEKPVVSHDIELGFWDLRAYKRDLRERLGADGRAQVARAHAGRPHRAGVLGRAAGFRLWPVPPAP